MRRFFMSVLVLLLAVLLSTGGAKDVSKAQMELVNIYLVQAGAEGVPHDAAQMMNSVMLSNSKTGKSLTEWELLIEYVGIFNSGGELPVSYTVEAGPGACIRFEYNKDWVIQHME